MNLTRCLFVSAITLMCAVHIDAQELAPAGLKPLVWTTGSDSRVETMDFRLIATDDGWKNAWLAHHGKTEQEAFRERIPTMSVDFEKCVVIAIFKGSSPNCRGIELASIAETEKDVTIRIVGQSYQTVGRADPSHPYAFVVLPATAKTIVLEEDGRHLKNEPAKWVERARLKVVPAPGR